MKKLEMILLLIFILALSIGCSKTSTSTTTNETNEVNKADDKMVLISGINVTDVAWVFEKVTYGSSEYRGETDAIYANDFTINAGAEFFKANHNASEYMDSEDFTETSNTTYEYKIQFVAGGPTPTDEDEQYVYDPYVAVVDFVIKGTYGELVTIEWDGTEFKQLD